jgi:transcription elongation factor SPT6
MMQDDNDDDRDNGQKKEAFVIWGRPEIPKLFASSHFSQKLCKNQPFVLKKAICLARWEQDPMNEVLNLWSPIMSENQALNIELHPFQKHINQARLLEKLEEINIQMVNSVGIDINLLVDHEHWHNQLQFLSGLGPRKAQKFIQKLKSLGKPLYTRNEIYEKKMMGKYCFISCFAQLKVRVLPEKRPE